METTQQIIRKMPNTKPDKRESMLTRETLKISLVILCTTFIWLLLFNGWKHEFKTNYETQIVKLENSIAQQADTVRVVSKPINYKDLCVVIKTSKDVRKYFVSYKKYYSKNNYTVNIREISFTEYMSINTNDTLTTLKFKYNERY